MHNRHSFTEPHIDNTTFHHTLPQKYYFNNKHIVNKKQVHPLNYFIGNTPSSQEGQTQLETYIFLMHKCTICIEIFSGRSLAARKTSLQNHTNRRIHPIRNYNFLIAQMYNMHQDLLWDIIGRQETSLCSITQTKVEHIRTLLEKL